MAKFPLIAVLDNVRSAFNVGSVLRTADCAGIAEVVTVGYTPVASHFKVKKTALGAEESVRSTHYDSLETAIQELRKRYEGVAIYALEYSEQSKSLWETELAEQPTAFIFGNEIDGVQLDITRRNKIQELHIPMFGMKESLNIANASAIAIYDAIKRWRD